MIQRISRLQLGPLVLCVLGTVASVVAGPRVDEALTRGVQLFERQQYREAEEVFRQIVAANATDAAGPYYLGRIHFALCDYDQALTHLERATALERSRSDYYFWLGRTYGEKARRSSVIKQAGLAKKVKRAFAEAVALDPGNAEARAALGNFYAQAPGFMGGGMDQATEQARALTALDPLKGELLRARILEEQKPGDAEATYRKLESNYGNSPGAADFYGAYGRFLLRQGRPGDAIEKLRNRVARGPGDASAHLDLAAAYAAAGRPREAVHEYQKAAEISPMCKPAKMRSTSEEQ